MTDRELAEQIWEVVKGRALPKYWTDKDLQEIIVRYWHKAMEKSQG